jgi:hypothetical protein
VLSESFSSKEVNTGIAKSVVHSAQWDSWSVISLSPETAYVMDFDSNISSLESNVFAQDTAQSRQLCILISL